MADMTVADGALVAPHSVLTKVWRLRVTAAHAAVATAGPPAEVAALEGASAWRGRCEELVRRHVALAVFDDTNIVDGPRFKAHLAQSGEVWWDTTMLPEELFRRDQ